MNLAVALLRGEVDEDPDIEPAVRLFISIHLGTIDRAHDNDVVGIDLAIQNSAEVVPACRNVID